MRFQQAFRQSNILPFLSAAAGTLLTLVSTAVGLIDLISIIIKAFPATQQADAETGPKAAQERANKHEKEAKQERERAYPCREEADRAAEQKKRMENQLEEAAQAVKRAEELASEAIKAAKEAARLMQEAREEWERSQMTREGAERVIAAAMEEAERVRKAAHEQRLDAEADEALAEERACAAAEESQRAIADAERRLKEDIQPVVVPSPDQVAATRRRIQYKEGCCHFAVAGASGTGKSSLVNAFRGLRGKDQGAAAVGVIETTRQLTRYADTDPNSPFVWYDAPGAGTLKCRDSQYFNELGFYVFDSIIVLFDNRFTTTDIAILANATQFEIPTYIVRSKADQHIQNVMREMGSDEDDSPERRDEIYWAARKSFIEETRKSVESNLEDANLPDQRVYIMSSNTLFDIVLNKTPKKVIDELDLLNDLLGETQRKRKSETVDVGK